MVTGKNLITKQDSVLQLLLLCPKEWPHVTVFDDSLVMTDK